MTKRSSLMTQPQWDRVGKNKGKWQIENLDIIRLPNKENKHSKARCWCWVWREPATTALFIWPNDSNSTFLLWRLLTTCSLASILPPQCSRIFPLTTTPTHSESRQGELSFGALLAGLQRLSNASAPAASQSQVSRPDLCLEGCGQKCTTQLSLHTVRKARP